MVWKLACRFGDQHLLPPVLFLSDPASPAKRMEGRRPCGCFLYQSFHRNVWYSSHHLPVGASHWSQPQDIRHVREPSLGLFSFTDGHYELKNRGCPRDGFEQRHYCFGIYPSREGLEESLPRRR